MPLFLRLIEQMFFFLQIDMQYLHIKSCTHTSYKQKKQKRGAAVLCQVSICLSVCHAANQLHHVVDEPLDVSPTYMHLLEFGIYNLFWLVNIVLLIMLFLYTENNLCFTCKLYTIKRNKVILLVLFFLVIILESAKSVSFIPILTSLAHRKIPLLSRTTGYYLGQKSEHQDNTDFNGSCFILKMNCSLVFCDHFLYYNLPKIMLPKEVIQLFILRLSLLTFC